MLSTENLTIEFILIFIRDITLLKIIEDVAVDPNYQGQGIGKEMMRHAIQLATENGCYKAVLSSNLKREGVHAFYESLDFERHGYSFRINAQQIE